MVDYPNYKTGIDKTGAEFLTASVETNESARRIMFLKKISRDELTLMLSLDRSPIVMSVPDKDVISKNLVASGSPDEINKRIQFELKNSQLDDPAEFCYDIVPTSDSSRRLTMVIRKSKLQNIQKSLSDDPNKVFTPQGYFSRSVALGKGFLEFCSNDTERLICLADFSTEIVSLCLVLGTDIVTPAGFSQSNCDWNSEQDRTRITAELKTIINFKLNELADKGIRIGLSKLIICGGKLSFNQKQEIAAKLSVELEAPRFKDSLLTNLELPANSTWADYLVSLGLTVD